VTQPKTAFQVYLESHPKDLQGNTNKPVVFFEPNSTQDGMRDFRVKQVPVDAEDPKGYEKFTPGGPDDPKDSSATASAPTSPVPKEPEKVPSVPVVKGSVAPPDPESPPDSSQVKVNPIKTNPVKVTPAKVAPVKVTSEKSVQT
jgi:hypothetical protein